MLSLLALASSAVWGTSDFFGGLVAKRLPAIAVVGITQGLAFVLLSVIVLVRIALGHPPEWGAWVGWAMLAGVAGATGLVAFYTALASGTMGVVAPIASMGVARPRRARCRLGRDPVAPGCGWASLVAVVGIVLASGPELSGAVSARPVLLACVRRGCASGLALFSLDRAARDSLLMTLWGMRCHVGHAVRRRRAGAALGGWDRARRPRHSWPSSASPTCSRTRSSRRRPPGAR